MSRRLAVGALVVALVISACGLGDKQAQAERIIDAADGLMTQRSVAASLGVNVKLLPAEREVVEVEPPRISPGRVSGLGVVLDPRDNTASVGGVVIFVEDVMYERIVPTVVRTPGTGVAAPSNLSAIAATLQGLRILDSVPASTTTTSPARTLRRSVQIVREWAAFDFSEIEDRDVTEHGGSLAINPVTVVRLATGVLTGSVERVGATEFKANVSRDKAERDLSEDEREILDKVFTANAISRRVFPATFRLTEDGALAAFSVTLRQQLSSKDRADLTLSFSFRGARDAVEIARPPRRGTVTMNTLGELVTTVSGA